VAAVGKPKNVEFVIEKNLWDKMVLQIKSSTPKRMSVLYRTPVLSL
jgi:hypothetical protein